VYVAAHNIASGAAGSDLAHNHAFKLTSIPRRSVVPGAISDPNQVASLVLNQPLYAGEQVTLRRFTDLKAEGIIGQLKGTMRAIQVPGDPNQLLAGTLKAGDHVDVVANLNLDANSGSHAVRIVLRDLTVLQAPASASSAPGSSGISAILAVTDTQVQRLYYVMKNAEWTFQLRPAVDASDSPERLDSLQSVLQSGGLR
jgi:Flp pilus assembly protein CpaB